MYFKIYNLLFVVLFFSINIISNCYPNVIIFKIQNGNILEKKGNYLYSFLNAIDNINYLLETIQISNIITVNDIFDKCENCFLNNKKKNFN